MYAPKRRPALRLAAPAFFAALALALPAGAAASNASLKRTLTTWSHRIGADARGIGLSATRRHPRRMTRRANHFRHDALLARRALAVQKPSTARGRRARALALAAFGNYAMVGREWALSGTARLHHHKALADRYALVAKRFAGKGNSMLVAAARLLR
ncbi:MAG: hypothetical protein WBB76_05800 [Gaiellaceae bacterium]